MSSLQNKVPAITLSFWVMKICATTLGETAGDLLSMTMDVGYLVSSLILFAVFAATLALQLLTRSHVPAIYWAVILSTSTAGTTTSDFLDRTVGLGYVAGSALLSGLLVLILFAWHRTTGSLAVDRLDTRKSEAFYWATILVSNTLGTAMGDFLADSSGLGFMGGAALIGGALAVVVALAFFTRISRVALFWCAFVLTRPFGATVGDVLTKDPDKGGLGFGTVGSSAILAAVLVILVVVATVRQHRSRARS